MSTSPPKKTVFTPTDPQNNRDYCPIRAYSDWYTSGGTRKMQKPPHGWSPKKHAKRVLGV